jgi:acetylornithine deacetylase/succinyl-diaminopimelate desuccinylase-like protein
VDQTQLRSFVDSYWDDRILPTLSELVAIPAQSPAFDADWAAHGHIDAAAEKVAEWIRAQDLPGTVNIIRLEGRTPLLFADIPGGNSQTAMVYAHLDKQPPAEGWTPGLGPWTPVLRDGRLYGRGSADDGYGTFAAIGAIKALRQLGIPHPRTVLTIETCEESGSYDLPAYFDALTTRIGTPSLCVILDSGAGDYDRAWVTTNLRGIVTGTLDISTIREGVHSGEAGGIVPSSFRVLRLLLNRIELAETGDVLMNDLYPRVPTERMRQAVETAAVMGDSLYSTFPWQVNAQPVSNDLTQLILNRTWRPQLEITGADGFPALGNAGNVLRSRTAVRISLRLPPLIDSKSVGQRLKQMFESDPPYGAKITFTVDQFADGWDAPPTDVWLETALRLGSEAIFGKEPCFLGLGGTLPLLTMLNERFPAAQFLVTGVLGPHSNAHGPNESLHIQTAKNVTALVATVLEAHYHSSA